MNIQGGSRPRYRILVVAEAANPEWASVPLIGWKLSQALSEVADVHLVTHIRNRAAILGRGLVEGRDFTAIDNEKVAVPLYKLAEQLRGGTGKGWTTSTAFASIAYYSFEAQLWHEFSKRIVSREYDVIHRITPLSPTSQSLIARRLARIDIPFVVGPLNGGVPWPKKFRTRQIAEREWLSTIRWAFKLMPAYRSTRRDSSAILVGSKFTYDQMPRSVRHKCFYVPENGVDVDQSATFRPRTPTLPLHAAFVGRLVPYKGADMLLEAAKEFLAEGKLKIHVIGDGPERSSLEKLAKNLGVEHAVQFHGWLAHEDVQEKLRNFDFLALPSIREFGGGVVVEAMALGVTPIVANYGGPAELVDERTGIRVAFEDKTDLIEGFRKAIGSVVGSPEILAEMGGRARQEAIEKLSWKAKANQIMKIYEAVLAGKKLQNNVRFY